MRSRSDLRIDVLQLGPWMSAELRQAIAGPFVLHPLFEASNRPALLNGCAEIVRAIICHSGGLPADRALLSRLPSLELILNLGSGVDVVDLEAAKERGIPVLNGTGLNAVDVAELAMGLVLALGRGILAGDRFVRSGSWLASRPSAEHRVSGKRLGILGMGAIGHQLATRAAAFDMEVAYFSRRPASVALWRFVPDVIELARHVDYLVNALPGGHATKHLVNADVLDALGPSGYLVSVGRGSVVDEAALVAALESGRIAGAALDVFENEPHVAGALVRSPRTVLQPHSGGKTHEAYDAIIEQAVFRLHQHFAPTLMAAS